jgi:orotidine-5'-phosphate decarboxylase
VNRILVALDVPRASDAIALADRLRGAVGGFKIGSELFTAAGPDVVRTLVAKGDLVFLDLKFHDIPNTVAGAVRSAAALGVWMLNVHAGGGLPMLDAAREAADAAGESSDGARPLVIAVTALTSLDAATLASVGVTASPREHVVRLASLAQAAGLDGVVASPQEAAAIRRAMGPDFLIVTPGIRGGSAAGTDGSGRHPGVPDDDQQRTATPAGAIAAGSSYLVIGRPITGASDPRAAADAIAKEIQERT